jgi:hypothetical protein
MPVSDMANLLALARVEPDRFRAAIGVMDDPQRRRLLRTAASGLVSRDLYLAFGAAAPADPDALVSAGITVYHGRLSLAPLSAFDLHVFRDPTGNVWGRTVSQAPTLAGPGYFAVTAGHETIVDYDRVPPQKVVPQGWPPVVPNSAGLPSLVYGGVQFRLRGDPDKLLTGTVWRSGRNQGVFVTLVRAA